MVFCWELSVVLSCSNRIWLFVWVPVDYLLSGFGFKATGSNNPYSDVRGRRGELWRTNSCDVLVTGAPRAEAVRSCRVRQKPACAAAGRGWYTHTRTKHTDIQHQVIKLTGDESDAHEEEDHSKDQATNSQGLVIWKEKHSRKRKIKTNYFFRTMNFCEIERLTRMEIFTGWPLGWYFFLTYGINQWKMPTRPPCSRSEGQDSGENGAHTHRSENHCRSLQKRRERDQTHRAFRGSWSCDSSSSAEVYMTESFCCDNTHLYHQPTLLWKKRKHH